MRTLKIAICVAVATSLLSACGGNSQSTTKKETATSTAETKSATTTTVYDVDQLLANADALTGKEVSIEGICTHICKHGGRKIFLMGSDDTKTIRIESGKVGKFEQKCVNSIVNLKGTLREERIDETYLVNWENKLNAKTEEKHGTGEEGCDTEKKARGESGKSENERIDNFRNRIAKRSAEEGKDYLSFYFVEAIEYSVK